MLRNRSKLISLNGFCSGVLAGLVAISSGSGYVSTQYAFIFGLFAGCLCNLACDIKNVPFLNIDDACNVFAGIYYLFIWPFLLQILIFNKNHLAEIFE